MFDYLIKTIGEENTLKLYELFSGQNIYFNKKILKIKRNKEIIKEYKKGENIKTLANKFNLSTNAVRKIVNFK